MNTMAHLEAIPLQTLKKLNGALQVRLAELLQANASLAALRQAQIEISREYKDLTVWGPEILWDTLHVTVVYGSDESLVVTHWYIPSTEEWRKGECGCPRDITKEPSAF